MLLAGWKGLLVLRLRHLELVVHPPRSHLSRCQFSRSCAPCGDADPTTLRSFNLPLATPVATPSIIPPLRQEEAQRLRQARRRGGGEAWGTRWSLGAETHRRGRRQCDGRRHRLQVTVARVEYQLRHGDLGGGVRWPCLVLVYRHGSPVDAAALPLPDDTRITQTMVRAVLKALLPKATFATVETVVPLRQLPQASDLNAAAAWGGVVLVGAVWMIQVSGASPPPSPRCWRDFVQPTRRGRCPLPRYPASAPKTLLVQHAQWLGS